MKHNVRGLLVLLIVKVYTHECLENSHVGPCFNDFEEASNMAPVIIEAFWPQKLPEGFLTYIHCTISVT